MTLPTLNQSTFTQIHTAGTVERIQVFLGRIQLADSASPAANDWQVLPEGGMLEVTGDKYARQIDPTAYVQVSAL